MSIVSPGQPSEPATPLVLRVALALFCLAGFIINNEAGYVGTGIESSSRSGTTVSAGATPVVIVWCLVGVLTLSLFLRRAQKPAPISKLSWWRRVGAFVLDLVALVTATAGLCALLPLAVEACRVGQFHWRFSRDFVVWQDWLSIPPSTSAALLLFLLYMAWPIFSGTQTVGGYVMRVAVVRIAPGRPSFRRCVIVAVFYLLDIWGCLFGWSLLERAGFKAVTVR
jgi:hypothetical protein